MGIRSMWLRRVVSVAGFVALLLLVPVAGAPAQLSPGPLQRYAEGTWASFVAMTDEQSGLPADTLKADGTRSVQTSTTNIGAYMWSALVAEQLRLIGHGETVERLGKTLTCVGCRSCGLGGHVAADRVQVDQGGGPGGL